MPKVFRSCLSEARFLKERFLTWTRSEPGCVSWCLVSGVFSLHTICHDQLAQKNRIKRLRKLFWRLSSLRRLAALPMEDDKSTQTRVDPGWNCRGMAKRWLNPKSLSLNYNYRSLVCEMNILGHWLQGVTWSRGSGTPWTNGLFIRC